MPAIPTRPAHCRRITSGFLKLRPRKRPATTTASSIAISQAARWSRTTMPPDADAGKSTTRADPFAPLTSELLEVNDHHAIHVESVGREGGIPAVYLHGGPGSGCQPDHRRLFY